MRSSSDEQKRLTDLTELLALARAEDPKTKAEELRLKAARIEVLGESMSAVSKRLADSQINEIVTLEARAAADAAHAKLFSDEFATEQTLAAVGGSEWVAMWAAAKHYSERHAYPGRDFPNTEDGSLCVLCQQVLTSDAQSRLSRFSDFVAATARETARLSKESADAARAAVTELRIGGEAKDVVFEIGSLKADLAEKIDTFFDSARACQADIAARVPGPRYCTVPPPITELSDLVREIRQRADAFLLAADPDARAKLEQDFGELSARKKLGESLDDVHREIDRRARLNAYDTCVKDADTRGLTKLGVELTKKYVTDALTASFAAELTTLGFTALELELKPASGQRGQLFHRLQLKHATRADLPKVVSEGESRCIALAAFMAELQCAGHHSAIIFDDPVSSLDHRWRSSVASRLVDAARTRQVVVFTHELVFLAALLQEAERAGVPADTQTLTRDRAHAGHVAAGLPWNGLPTRKRIGILRERWVRADKVFRTAGPDEYDPLATAIYAGLRQTWERSIEEVLLNQAILRFRPGIETNRLKKIADISDADLDAIERGMTKCSRWEGGHDQAMAVNERLPPPVELKQDIDALETWVAAVEKRRK